MSRELRTLVAACGLAALLVPSLAHARNVKRCGITIGPGKTGKLVKNVQCRLVCTSDPTVPCTFQVDDYRCPLEGQGCREQNIFLERNATLDLNGFDLTAVYNATGIVCSAGTHTRCTIKGPGTFFAAKSKAITPNNRDVVLKDLTIDRDYIGFTTKGWVHATNVRIQNCSSVMVGEKGATVKNSSFGADCGIDSGKNLFLDKVDSIDGLFAAGTLRARDVTVRDGQLRGKDVFLTRAEAPVPVDTTPVEFRASVSAQRRLVLRDSTVGGIESGVSPVLHGSTCVQSRKTGTSTAWGVCTND